MLRGRFFLRFRRQLSERIPALLPTLYPVTDVSFLTDHQVCVGSLQAEHNEGGGVPVLVLIGMCLIFSKF